MKTSSAPVQGAGLGLRRDFLQDILASLRAHGTAGLGFVQFVELAPENWARLGGRFARDLRQISEALPICCHGLSLSLGGTDALDVQLLRETRRFMQQHGIALYTEHLSWCAHEGQLYDLLPIACTEEAVHHVAARIRQAQDILEMRIGVENASYYIAPPGAQMTEAQFISAVVQEADCLLHLDVNNIYVNSSNHGFDALAYMQQLPLERTCYMHVAGHHVERDGLIVDTHGAAVIDPVWQLLTHTYAELARRGLQPARIPTCLERDFNFPPLADLLAEVGIIASMQEQAGQLMGCAP